jgi:ArsR family transcriptional regulator
VFAAMPKPKNAAVDCCAPGAPGTKVRARATRAYVPLCKALADETRLEILGMLAERTGELCACEIEAHFDLSQPTISHHLKILRQAGLVRATRRGTWQHYSLERAALARLGELRALLAD